MTKGILVHLGLGSNLGDRFYFLNNACNELNSSVLIDFRASTVFESSPLLKMKQPNYLNLVVCGLTQYSPEELLVKCLKIENHLGRVRKEKWGPRNIDIDIISYGKEILETKKLIIPHPEIENRGFVLNPLNELSPSWKHPKTGLAVDILLNKWEENNLEDHPKPLKQKINLIGHMRSK